MSKRAAKDSSSYFSDVLKKTKENRESASKILKVFQDVRKDTENLDLLVCIKDKSIHVEDKEILLRIHYGNQIFWKIKSFFEKLAGSCVSQPLLLRPWKLRCDELEEQSASSQNMSDSDFLIFNTFFINTAKRVEENGMHELSLRCGDLLIFTPPVSKCISCNHSLNTHNQPTAVTTFTLTSIKLGIKEETRCVNCNINYKYSTYGNKESGYIFYEHERPFIEASGETYFHRNLCRTAIVLG